MEVVRGKNTYYTAGDIMLIMLTQGQIATIDTEDYDKVKGYKWFANIEYSKHTYYAIARKGNTHISLHRLLSNSPYKMEIDHKNHNGLDNCKCNIRTCTPQQNKWNRGPIPGKKYKGVYKYKDCPNNPYMARIKTSSIQINLGFFPTEVEAAKAYDREAAKRYGEFAYLNFPEE